MNRTLDNACGSVKVQLTTLRALSRQSSPDKATLKRAAKSLVNQANIVAKLIADGK